MNKPDKAFGVLVRKKRNALGSSQTGLAMVMKWPQAKLSRVEQGKRSVTLDELLEFARVFRCGLPDLLGELDGKARVRSQVRPSSLSPEFSAAFANEEALLGQLARYGVRFLGVGGRPALFALPPDEVLLAALQFSRDPRVFEALPALLLRQAEQVDWGKLASAAYTLKLQNRLGMVVAAALQLKDFAKDVDNGVWKKLEDVQAALADAKLDKEEVVGPVPKTEDGWAYLRARTPDWLRAWNGVGVADLDSFRRYLPQ